jgi:hypothetical protein
LEPSPMESIPSQVKATEYSGLYEVAGCRAG